MDNTKVPKNATTLVLSSGSIKGCLQLGALKVLEENNYLKHINTYIGCSVGALIGLFLAIGYTVYEIQSISLLVSLLDRDQLNFGAARSFIDKYGLLNHSEISTLLESLICKKMSYIPTFYELFEQKNIKLVFVASNISKREVLYMNYLTTPTLNLADAVLMSMNIPIIFPKIVYKGDEYIDGAFGDPYPLYYATTISPVDKIIGLCITTIKNSGTSESFLDYLYKISTFTYNIIQQKNNFLMNSKPYSCSLVSDGHYITGSSKSYADRIDLYLQGYSLMKGIMKGIMK